MSATAENKVRLSVTVTDMDAVRAALGYAGDRTDEVNKANPGKHYPTGRFVRLEGEVEKLLAQKRLLRWGQAEVDGRPVPRDWDAMIGTKTDGALFSLSYRETCYRRGRWCLLIQVFEGDRHHDWGCFDAADQPTRYYHVLENAIEEAEAIAAVLVADRMERGPIEGWVPDGKA
jgi:hypothetical protein